MKNILRLCSVSLLPIFIASCQTTSNVGDGDIYFFRDNFVASYNSYIAAIDDYPHHSFAFVYDKKSGAFGWQGRPSQNGINYAIDTAIKGCQKNDKDRNCQIFDLNGRVVWKGLNEERKQELVSYAHRGLKGRENKVVKFSSEVVTVGVAQKKKYKSYLSRQGNFDHTAFFVSANGNSAGEAYSYGTSTTSYTLTIRNALKSCQLQSETSKCYLFAANGKPVNSAASEALEKK
ncbi:MAG: hypothetical protein V7750_01110 [Sneathiella sp.]